MFYDSYTLIDWFLFFYIYCFLGWCVESTYVSLQKGHPVNRGFMRGPFLPIYGCGAVIMLFVTIPVRQNLFLTFLFGAIGASILEYVTGALMEALFKVRYWDYSNQPFNLNGHICLGTTLAWGCFTLLLVKVLHAPVEHVVMLLYPRLKGLLVLLLTIVVTADFTLSFKAALDFRDLLAKMNTAKEELDRIQTRLDAIIAFSNPKSFQQSDIHAVRQRLSEKLQATKSRLDLLQREESLLQFRDELDQLKAKYLINNEYRQSLSDRMAHIRKDFWKIHPSITSKKFEDALRELKELTEEKHHKKQ